MKTLLALILLFAANVHGQVLIYKRTVNRTTMGNGHTWKIPVHGYLVVDAVTGAAAELDIDPRAKEFLVRSKTLTVSIVRGGLEMNYTVFAEWGAGTDNLGPYKYSSTAKGINVSLNIGFTDKRPVPRTMHSTARDVFRIGLEPFIDEETGTFAIDLPRTQGANTLGQTVEDVRATILSNLTDKGYKDTHP